jgi:hypothetical protein
MPPLADVVGDANKDGDGIAHFNCDYTKQSDLNSRRPCKCPKSYNMNSQDDEEF